jgi:hypothetical protein
MTAQETNQYFIVWTAMKILATGQRFTSVLIQMIESGKMRWTGAWGMYGGGKEYTLSFSEETGKNETHLKT